MDRHTSTEMPLTEAAQAAAAMLYAAPRKQTAALIRAVLRGERPVSDLTAAGISANDPAPEMFAGLPMWSSDYAEGLLNLKGDAAALTKWAQFVIRVAELFDYAAHDIPCCRRLMEYVWQIPNGGGLSPRAVTLATMVRYWPRHAA